MAEKVTVMVLKVDLQCSCCYKKIKKLLCKFPQIRDQKYDEKQNQVIITVVCCSPEKIRDKLCCEGGKVIERIDIITKPPKPEPNGTKKSDESKQPVQPEEPESKKLMESEPAPPPCQLIHVEVQYGCPHYSGRGCCGPCSEGYSRSPCYHEHKRPTLLPPPPLCPGRRCCGPCSEGYPWGPCYHKHERPTLLPPPPPQSSCEGYGYGGGKGCRVSRCDYYFNEENPQGCTIM